MHISLKILSVLLFIPFSVLKIYANIPPIKEHPDFLLLTEDHWVKSKIKKMTIDEKIAQLMFLPIYPKHNESSQDIILKNIKKYKPGGILIMQGSPLKTANFIDLSQKNSTTPLLVAIDGEWGLSMRIDSTVRYPYAQAIGAIQSSEDIIQMGREIGQQMQLLGIQMNFAPVADINTNPNNPVINFRSYGENKINVTKKISWIVKGMQDSGIIPVAKHFPGHGDTKVDSHKSLPVIKHTKERINSIESFPFRYLAGQKIPAIMSGHISIPSIDNSGLPSSLSKKVIDGYLRTEIGYKGLVITDAINMKGAQNKNEAPVVSAIKAGNDMIGAVPDLSLAIKAVKQSLANGDISIEEINNKCKRVLALKRWTGLHLYQKTNKDNLTEKLQSPYYEVTNRKLIKNSITVLINQKVLPVQNLNNLKIASVIIGEKEITPFQRMLSRYTYIDHFSLDKNASEIEISNLSRELRNYDLVLAGITGLNIYPGNKYGITQNQLCALADFISHNNVITTIFGNAYAIKHFRNIDKSKGLIVTYQDTPLTQELAAQLIFGAFTASGKLPITIDKRFRQNDGIIVKKNQSLAYTIPEEIGINSTLLNAKIDSLANLGLREKAYPGCQVLIAKDGNVFFHKCYGFQTFDNKQKVTKKNIYDWASLTKVTGPLPAIMKLVDEKKLNIDAPFSKYWAPFKGTDKGNIHVRDYLTHQAGLPAWIPFWKMGIDKNEKLSPEIFAYSPSKQFPIRISNHLYVNKNFKKAMFDTIRTAKLLPRKKYVYSDLGFHLYPTIISQLTGVPYEKYIKTNFYGPLGATTITYNPYLHYPLKNIIPTETDDFFRHERLRGFVHDEGAAMLGGVSGNAGLFGSANDLAKIFQMYLQKGFFGGKRFISEKTVNEFTSTQFPENDNRRGIGFDKPLIDNNCTLNEAYPSISASKNSFGHTGYTGTMAWADPNNGILFIFMSNRVYPTRNNSKLYDLNIRTAMHQSIYNCLKENANNND